MGILTDMVRFNVRGRIFETTATTLANAGRNSLFGAIFDDNWNLQPSATATTEHFIDRNPDCLAVLLDLLGLGELQIPTNILEKLLYREADIGAPIMDERRVRDAINMEDTNSMYS
ncbi:unnamed protein product [Fraxinus pennsylvanica]|uniref:Potassium channel tetramerisation-type BTB domain-containing protein n=1 Tax=Fraxinus pennsylvanica TaxID=56036 RepID=A0AAD2A8N4_9LAMI|nr:unnamed protein product [Fraxinus pennsylvanica]